MATIDGAALYRLVFQELRPPATWDTRDAGAFTWDPPLSVAEQATLADLQAMATFGVTSAITLAEWRAIKPDLAVGRAFVGLPTPTAGQTNAALKAALRVIGALLRQ